MKTGNIGIRNLAAIGIADIDVYGTSNRRILTIKYLSSTVDEKNINLTFVVTQNNLTKLNATIFVQETNADNETAVNKIIKLQNIRDQKVTVSFDKNKKFDRYLWQSGLLFQATITCDGFSAETDEFKLKFEKSIETKIEECLCKKTILSADDLRYIVTQLRKLEDPHLEIQYNEITDNPKWIDSKGNVYESNDRGKAPKENLQKYSVEKTFYDSKSSDKKIVKDKLFYLDFGENIQKRS